MQRRKWKQKRQNLGLLDTDDHAATKWEEFWEDHGGMEVVRMTIGRKRQSLADGQKKNFQSK